MVRTVALVDKRIDGSVVIIKYVHLYSAKEIAEEVGYVVLSVTSTAK